nr:AAA family ATPase [Bacillus sp. FJAT-50079]
MKSLHIYGYGKLIDFHIHNLSSLQLFYGENEAGKSTIMSFIHSILFGFPSRQQSIKRYEPKNHSAYGGQIIAYFPSYGDVTIERVKGKSAGDVTVILQDGTVGKEPLLAKLLDGLDRIMYESIFSFNLQAIQEVQGLKENDIGRYLVAAGTIGTDVLFHAEEQLQKEQDLLFKPGGRKPKLNERIQEIRALENELKLAKQQNAEYETLVKQEGTIRNQITEIEIRITATRAELVKVDELLKSWPLLIEKKEIQRRLNEQGSLDFPIDGLSRFEKYKEQLIAITSRQQALKERRRQTMEQMASYMPLEASETMVSKAEQLISEWPRYEQLLDEMTTMDQNVVELENQAHFISRELHFSKEDWGELDQLNLGMEMKGRIKDALQRVMNLQSRSEELLLEQELVKKDQLTIEQKCQEIEESMLPESKFQQLQNEEKRWKSTEQLSFEQKRLETELAALFDKKQNEKQTRESTYVWGGGILLICTIMLIWSISSSEWIMAVFSLTVIAYSIFNGRKVIAGKARLAIIKEIEQIQSQLHVIKDQLSDRKLKENYVSNQYKQQIKLRDEWKKWVIHLEQVEQRLAELEKQQTSISQKKSEVHLELYAIKDALHLQKELSIQRMEDAFELLKELIQLLESKKNLEEKLRMKREQYHQWLAEVYGFIKEIGLENIEHEKMAYFHLKEFVNGEMEKQLRHKEYMTKLSEIDDDLLPLHKQIVTLNDELNELHERAATTDEEQYRLKAQQYAEQKKLIERLELLEASLTNGVNEFASSFQNELEINKHRKLIAEKLEGDESRLYVLRNQDASIRHQIFVLEEGGTYTEKLHRFHQLKSIFNEEAKQWAKFALAKQILTLTMNIYKEERFPKVMKKAQQYFSLLTSGKYIRLVMDQEGKLMVERKDRLMFYPGELSQGTGEQLYISLRFALVDVLFDDYPFPVMIDDGFVNFDKERTEKVLKLISTTSKKNQVLFFTCHSHIRDYFVKDEIIDLPRKTQLDQVEQL